MRAMIFSDWRQKSKGLQVSKSLLWEYDLTRFDWQRFRVIVMHRVVERGTMNDFYAAIRLYGGIAKVREIIKEIPTLSDIDMNFVCSVFGLRKEQLRCYTRRLSRERLLNA